MSFSDFLTYLLWTPVVLIGVVLLLAVIRYFTSDLDEALGDLYTAQHNLALAELARLKRQADQDIPPDTASEISVLNTQKNIQIDIMRADAEIKLWAERGNAEKVLEYTRKKHELEKELRDG